MSSSAYENLEKRFKRIHNLEHMLSITHWDSAVMMPQGGAEARGAALAEVDVMCVELTSDPQVGEWIASAEADSGLCDWQRANLREMKRQWKNATCVSGDLVEAKSLANSKCEQAWRSLRGENNWKDFLPLFDEVVKLSQEEAQQRSDAMGTSPYESLLHLFEPGGSVENIDRIFTELKDFLPNFLNEVLDKQAKEKVEALPGPFAVEKQRQVGLEIMKSLGFNFDHGRLDVSHHPFCGGVPKDVRITTRYKEDDFTQSLMGIIHETGHASYEQGLPWDWLHQPVGNARGMSLHEGQSLLFEMQLGRSREFLDFARPLLQKHLAHSGTSDSAWSLDNLAALYSRVERGFIRVDADEITYPLHVILRYEIERDLVEKKITAKDLPDVWHQKMTEYLGLSTEGNYKDGCMQDVHWPGGSFGYFPTYTLGAMTAAQLFATAKKEVPSISEESSKGNFKPVTDWLRDKIWGQASYHSVDDLLVSATGKVLDASFFVNHLKQRY